ncbi:NAD-dependent epimerase/dehydratase family protein [Bacillus salitolerans]|uniref:NAD-dependent epimerase/dehydratase family protein n=1 Tax=Bacillus salitolerans TaxID=1437434 RepID=A0ABW4LML4_9BACI
MDRVIVIGVYGFLGNHLCTTLLEEGITVFGIDAFNNDEMNRYKEEKEMLIGRNANYHILEFDRIFDQFSGHENKVDAVYYCDEQSLSSVDFLDQVLSFCKENSIKLIFTSSLSIFNKKENTITEETMPSPVSAKAKRYVELEEHIRTRSKEEAIHYTIIRLPVVYGPWQPETFAFQSIISKQEKGEDVKDIEDDGIGDVLFIEDVIHALIKAGSIKQTPPILHISSGKEGQWVKAMNYLLKKRMNKEVAPTLFLNNLAAKVLTFEPQYTVEEGLERQRQHVKSRNGSPQ